ncbi:MAG: 5-(carboxyamino)imidazole ribonucleotide mutase [Litorivicinaceae bacterium]
MTVRVGVIMGSDSDWPVMEGAVKALQQLEVGVEATVVSAHRTPDRLVQYAKEAADRGLDVIIAGAGGAAHLPGMVASMTALPVIGVPVIATSLNGQDALLSIVQMPQGVPVATVAINGAFNAGLLAAQMLAISDIGLRARLVAYKAQLATAVLQKAARVEAQVTP